MATNGGRFLTLDVFRGLTIAFMILVNNAGNHNAVYRQLRHAKWNGFTGTDLVFPAFLVIVGIAISFTIDKLKNMEATVFFNKVLIRSFLIYAIGFIISNFPFYSYIGDDIVFAKPSDYRIFGVLQRIALTYLVTTLLAYYFSWRLIAWIGLIILLGYWPLLQFFGDFPSPLSLESNLVRKVDVYIFGERHLYQHYGVPFDPEGLVSTLPSIVTVIIGYLTGIVIKEVKQPKKIVPLLFIASLLMIGLGYLWDTAFPINKPLWSSSYVLFSGGWSLLVLTFLFVVIDFLNFTKWSYFFEVFGKNPLFIYALSGIAMSILHLVNFNDISLKNLIYGQLFSPYFNEKNASLMFAIVYMIVMWIVAYVMDRKKIYIKL
ncbi:hypothetical protein BCY91_10995 [Pelobium manganitolerans]|uniref:Heparan-alpha-glucosaminide N-acetyltransferase catalytic domain-containing protein n=1 Tax=Pelobium manganitolerans TaxID=1842495 RepID=A0A419S214_9SPHI|nr:heparan-alpha-glucosaminide N-acetyltransferase domain-containing protein [Pelobium manganitolerans]RKD12771.1 hypothetical protein BCY91_10995 [Pelobium manganitolerans]